MNKILIVSVSIICIGAFIAILVWQFTIDRFRVVPEEVPDYKGVCLFDIDGTLTAGRENEQVVQYCLDKGYAVGIATAGSIYKPSNLLSYSWMPHNLYKFMKERDFDTFNNVGSGILMGQHNSAAYTRTLKKKPSDVFWAGWFKGLALERTGLLYGIQDQSNLILFDNDPSYLIGIRHYNSNLQVVCAGMPCNGTLTLDVVRHILN
jgi:hypothetical protein